MSTNDSIREVEYDRPFLSGGLWASRQPLKTTLPKYEPGKFWGAEFVQLEKKNTTPPKF